MGTPADKFGSTCPPSPASLADLQQLLNAGPGTPLPRPPGGFRTSRCQHGFRCDSEEWLCEACPNPHRPRESQRKLHQRERRESIHARVLEYITAHPGADPIDVAVAIYGHRIRTCSVVSVIRCLRADGKL